MRTTRSRPADGAYAPSALLAAPGGSEERGRAGDTGSRPEPNLEDDDTGDLATGVDEDALNEDELDTDQIASRE